MIFFFLMKMVVSWANLKSGYIHSHFFATTPVQKDQTGDQKCLHLSCHHNFIFLGCRFEVKISPKAL
jgi:hypothetical protein